MKNSDHAEDSSTQEVTYTGVYALSENHIIIPSIIDEFSDKNCDHALVFHLIDESWAQELVDNSICGVCARYNNDRPEIFNAGVNGKIYITKIPGEKTTETIASSDGTPNYSETIRCIKILNNEIYCVGMARQVYKRTQEGEWINLSRDIYTQRENRTVTTGFLDITSLAENEIYVIGYNGEIWQYNRESWIKRETRTNVALTKAVATKNNDIVVVGLAGTILRGRDSRWVPIAAGQSSEDFWGVSEFQGRIYISSDHNIFTLEGDTLKEVQLPEGTTTSYLHSTEDALWSVGAKDICYTSDGNHWLSIENP